jgi:CYTH domain-containing protein/CHAD domain-containing protein
MAFAIEPSGRVQRAVRRVARERLDLAIGQLEGVSLQTPADVETTVHDVRKRCKEVRALARLVRQPLGDEYDRFNTLVRDAANELSSIRDAHALVAALDDLRDSRGDQITAGLDEVRSSQAEAAADATSQIRSGDPRIARAQERLVSARRRVRHWNIGEGSAWLTSGLAATYRRGRRGLRQAQKHPTDERLHQWRKRVKTLWYQVRLIEAAAPSVLTPLIVQLHDLAEALGDDHDLSVLVDQLESDRKGFGGEHAVETAVALAREQQADLRCRAYRLGQSLYAETTSAFVARLDTYWATTLEHGVELVSGAVAQLLADEQPNDGVATPEQWVERERKFLVADVPEFPGAGTEFRQGYLAIDGTVSVRVRDAGIEGCTVTVKAGRGAVRTEFEWPITPDQFEAVWPLTRDRHIHKTRFRLPFDDVAVGAEPFLIELDVFHDVLDGLVLAEVEFESTEEMAAFVPPAWFGDEVTDDVSYTNASLAVRARPA